MIYSPGKDRDGRARRSRSSATSHDELMASTPPPLLASDIPPNGVTPSCSIGFCLYVVMPMMSGQVILFQTALRCRDRVHVDEIAVAKLKMHNPASPIFTALTSAGNDNPIATILHVAVRERMVIMHDMTPRGARGAKNFSHLLLVILHRLAT